MTYARTICTSILLLALPAVATEMPAPDYSFVVAGHLYGAPNVKSAGLYQPFMQSWQAGAAGAGVEFAVFTGDLVSHATEKQWELVDADIDQLGLPVYIAPGNHDLIDRPLYEERYGRTYFSFTHNEDLFIVLDSELDESSITGAQLEFLQTTLDGNPDARNVFVFMHSLVWIAGKPEYRKIKTNRPYEKDATNNFWPEVAPLLISYGKPVWVFGGDLGATRARTHYVIEKLPGLTLAATGMGSGRADNFMRVAVYADGVALERVDIAP